MLEEHIRKQAIQFTHQEVVPAVGCAEPMAVALYVARTTKMLGCRPEKITTLLSANILKNVMGVGIPGTRMIGLPIAIALGSTIGKSEYQLEVIEDLTPQTLEDAKEYIGEERIDIQSKQGITERLYIGVTCQVDDQTAKATIAGAHTNFVYLCKNGEVLFDKRLRKQGEPEEDGIQLSLRMIYNSATTTPIDEIRFMLETKEYNMNAANQSLKGNYSHCLGKTMDRPLSRGMFGSSIYSHIIAKMALACDTRTGGAMIPVMSNSGSGNQGICATNPVVVYVMENESMEEELIRALTLSHLSATYIRQSLDKSSVLCGRVMANIGSSCDIACFIGGGYVHTCHAIKDMIANLTDMICDGAKSNCSLGISSGTDTVVLSALLSMENKHVTSAGGIIDEDVDRSIRSLTGIGRDAMGIAGKMVLNIMTSKQRCQVSFPNLHLSPVKSMDIQCW